MRFILFILFLVFSVPGFSTHLEGGEIIVDKKVNTVRTYVITIKFTLEESSIVTIGNGILSLGDGTLVSTDAMTQIDNSTYTIEHTYPEDSQYIIWYTERNRTGQIDNYIDSVDKQFVLSTMVDLRYTSNYSSPRLISDVKDVYYLEDHDTLEVSLAATDPNGNILTYSLIEPYEFESGSEDYSFPEYIDLGLRSGSLLLYSTGYPYGIFDYLLILRIDQFKEIDGQLVHIGYYTRDFLLRLHKVNLDPISKPLSIADLSRSERESILLTPAYESTPFTFEVVFNKIISNVNYETEWEDPQVYLDGNLAPYVIIDTLNYEPETNLTLKFSLYYSTQLNKGGPFPIVIRSLENTYSFSFYVDYKPVLYLPPIDFSPQFSPINITNRLSFFPNPASDYVFVEGNSEPFVEIYDSKGRFVCVKRVNNLRVDLYDLNPGLYIVRCLDQSTKLIIN